MIQMPGRCFLTLTVLSRKAPVPTFHRKNKKLYTPEGRNVLRGITRMYIIDLATRLSIPVQERNIELYDVIHADEAFFTSTAISIMPCTKINGLAISNGKMGEVTKYLLDEWSKEIGVDIIRQTRDFAGEVGVALSGGTNIYRFERS